MTPPTDIPATDSDPGQDIIFAKASGAGAAALSVLRLSGAGAHALVASLCPGRLPAERQASLRKLRAPESGEVLDEALVLLFGEGRSYTGEESAELHLHGGEAVSTAVFAALERLGARLARPGEFSRRALALGRLDLAQAEAVGALVAAETDAERRIALRGLSGEIKALSDKWRAAIIEAAALLETGVDFVDEALGDDLIDDAARRIAALSAELSAHIDASERAALAPEHPVVALLGPPNAGKSSLLNAISGLDRAIVSDEPGTTRDSIDVTMRIAGRKLALTDTAGMRKGDNSLENQGIARSLAHLQSADRRIFVLSHDTLAAFQPLKAHIRPDDALFWTKSDVSPPKTADWAALPPARRYMVSARKPAEAREALARYIAESEDAGGLESPLSGSERRLAVLRDAGKWVGKAEAAAKSGALELAIEDLRRAAASLEALTGAIGHEDVLDAVFSRFCIGK